MAAAAKLAVERVPADQEQEAPLLQQRGQAERRERLLALRLRAHPRPIPFLRRLRIRLRQLQHPNHRKLQPPTLIRWTHRPHLRQCIRSHPKQ